MKLTLPYIFTEKVVPYRCRKPRSTQFPATISLTIREVEKKDAPVAFVKHYRDIYEESCPGIRKEYRWYKGKLYVQSQLQRYSGAEHATQTAPQFVEDPYPFSLVQRFSKSYGWYGYPANEGKQANRQRLLAWARSVLFIDGERWETANEPRYVVQTFGLGHNHGGTGLFATDYYNSNIPKTSYFRIDQFKQAVNYATKTALGRGDDRSLHFEDEYTPRFEIFVPKAVKLKPNKEHGNGNPFMNKCESIIRSSPHASVAGFGLMALLPEIMLYR